MIDDPKTTDQNKTIRPNLDDDWQLVGIIARPVVANFGDESTLVKVIVKSAM